MRVSIGLKTISGPWGGGNQVAVSLMDQLKKKGISVYHNFADPMLDLILLWEPDPKLTTAYTHKDILRYLLFKNPKSIVIHRINNTSEARDDKAKVFNKFRIDANKIADHTIFISNWVHQKYVEAGFKSKNYSIIYNGGEKRLWQNAHGNIKPDNKFTVVTHHWSSNLNKGFDIYKKLDEMLNEPEWSKKVTFTFVGRLPPGLKFKNVRCIKPLTGQALVNEIQNHDIYLTASKNEAAGMHHIEGALSGLPILYRESGALPEYCTGYGVSFNEINFPQKLQEIIENYDYWKGRMDSYPFTSERMGEEYFKLFVSLLNRRDELISRRKWKKDPVWMVKTLWPYRITNRVNKHVRGLKKRIGLSVR